MKIEVKKILLNNNHLIECENLDITLELRSVFPTIEILDIFGLEKALVTLYNQRITFEYNDINKVITKNNHIFKKSKCDGFFQEAE